MFFFHQIVFGRSLSKFSAAKKLRAVWYVIHIRDWYNDIQIADGVVIVYVTYYVLDVEAWTCWRAHGGDGSDAGGICG